MISDRDMLTWMILNDASFGTTSTLVGLEGREPVWREQRFVRRPCRYSYEWHCHEGATERDAIQTAMNAEPCSPDGEHFCTQSRGLHGHMSETPLDRLREKTVRLLDALYRGSPDATALRAAADARIAAAPWLTDESKAAYALRDLLDEVMTEAE